MRCARCVPLVGTPPKRAIVRSGARRQKSHSHRLCRNLLTPLMLTLLDKHNIRRYTRRGHAFPKGRCVMRTTYPIPNHQFVGASRVAKLGTLVVASLLITSCFSASAPDHQDVASVSGDVMLASGAPLSSSTVGIRCADGAVDVQTPTDARGSFGVGISVERPTAYDSIPCEFRAPANTPVVVDTVVVRLFPWGVPIPLQMIHLQQPNQE